MRILVDAMGGDNAPDQIALGAIQAAKDFGCETVLVGRGEAILQALKDQGIETLPKGVEIANADDVVDMHDDPATVVKKKKDSSMVVGLTMLKEGGGDAFVSAGSTGALLSAATLIVRRVKGIRRAAMGPQIPTKTGRECVLIDCGATADCTPEFLLQFAFMGSYYAEKVLGIENPRVALLNIGAEDSKGGELQKAVYPLLKQAGEAGKINFTGNIEARDVPLGGADVVVSDGFSGNILLKGIEGTALFMASMMKDMFKKNLLTKLAALLCMDGVKAFKKKMDYRETGGSASSDPRKALPNGGSRLPHRGLQRIAQLRHLHQRLALVLLGGTIHIIHYFHQRLEFFLTVGRRFRHLTKGTLQLIRTGIPALDGAGEPAAQHIGIVIHRFPRGGKELLQTLGVAPQPLLLGLQAGQVGLVLAQLTSRGFQFPLEGQILVLA